MTSLRDATRAHDVLEILGDLAAIAEPDQATDDTPALLGRLAETCGAVACQLDTTVTDATDGDRFSTVASVGYSREVSDYLCHDFTRSPHGRLVAGESGLRRIAGDTSDFRSTSHFLEVLHPAGYDDGVSLALRTSSARLVGILHLSATRVDDFAPELGEVLGPIGRACARVASVATYSTTDVSLPPDYAVARIDSAGRPTHVVGRPPLHVRLDADLLATIRACLQSGSQFMTFLWQQDGRLVEVRVHAPSRRPGAHQPCVVATRPATTTLGLTVRQLEVLTAVATGAGNREIAEELCLTQRTVAAHVEAVLTRLSTRSRAGAAAKAAAAGVLLPSADPASVRSLQRVLERPRG